MGQIQKYAQTTATKGVSFSWWEGVVQMFKGHPFGIGQ
jgi:hypothetical protein